MKRFTSFYLFQRFSHFLNNVTVAVGPLRKHLITACVSRSLKNIKVNQVVLFINDHDHFV